MGTVVALAGQVGGAKLADGLYRLCGKDLAVIVNTGDDFQHLGLSFSPDLDTVLYMLAGIGNPAAPWEPEHETRAAQAMLKKLGGPDRPSLGDRSLATALLRTHGLAHERRLTEVTLDFCRALGVKARILPMSDDRVSTQVITDGGSVSYHEYFAELGCEPPARGLEFAGAADARISDEVMDALHAEDLEAIVICPSNPFHIIRPILEVAGMRAMLKERGVPIVAVTPIVGGKALKGSAGKMMSELGREPSARGAASEYLRLIDGFVIDRQDFALVESVRSLGMEVAVSQTVMRSPDERVALARAALDFARSIREKKAAEVE